VLTRGMQRSDSAEMKIVGKHVYANLYDCDPWVIDDEERLVGIVKRTAEITNSKLIQVLSWRFGGEKGGVSAIALINESHIAIHTWKAYNYATVDIYTCGTHTDPEKGLEYIISQLKPVKTVKHAINRSLT